MLEARNSTLANEHVKACSDCAVVVNIVLIATVVVDDDRVVFFILVDLDGLMLDPFVEAIKAGGRYHCVVGEGDSSVRIVVIVNAIDLEHFEVRSLVVNDGYSYITKLIQVF